MKRRTFMQGAAALATASLSYPVLGYPALSAELPSDKVTKATPDPYLHVRKKQFLFVVKKYNDALAIYRAMGSPRNAKVVSMGAAICGYGANFVIMDDVCEPQKHSVVERKLVTDWYNQTVRTRLMPGGEMHSVSFMAPKNFNYDRHSGIEASFQKKSNTWTPVAPDYVTPHIADPVRQGMRFFKPKQAITKTDEITARATLFTWFMEKHSG